MSCVITISPLTKCRSALPLIFVNIHRIASRAQGLEEYENKGFLNQRKEAEA
jgi:hypothetical protein